MRARTRTLRSSLCPPGLPSVLPVLTVESAAPGPRVAICANLHGDECLGIGVVHELAARLPDDLQRGAVRLYPSLNPEGLKVGARKAPGASRDLNRVFPGDPHGGPSDRIAHTVWQDLLAFEPELVLDLHADSSASIPYAIVDRLITARGEEKRRRLDHLERLAQASGLTVIRDYREAPYRRFGLDSSLSGALVNHGRIGALCLELGPRRLVEPASVQAGLTAVLGVLDALGLAEAPAPEHPSLTSPGPWRRDSGPRTGVAGVLRPRWSPGSLLQAGQVLATVHGLDGTLLERLECDSAALVLSLVERAWIPQGEAVATLAVPDPD